MRFMILQKNDAKTEADEPPSPELLQRVQGFFAELATSGRFLDGEGLRGSRHRTRLTFRGGEATVKHGPYGGSRELHTAALLLAVRDRDEAIAWATRYGKVLGDGELELGKLIDPWDVGMPMPENPRRRFLLVDMADAASEGAGRPAQVKAGLTRLETEMTKAGVLEGAIHLAPSRRGKRLQFRGPEARVVDGPFSESKELIGGYLVMELPDLDAAVEICRRYAALHGELEELDVREIVG